MGWCCSICQSEEFQREEKKKLSVIRCRSCGLKMLNTPNPAENVAGIYQKSDYYKSWGLKEDVFYQEDGVKQMKISCFRKRWDHIERYCKKGKVLDVGCAFGFFLELAEEKGWDVYGIEISPFSSTEAKKRFGDRVFTGMLKDAAYNPAFFDLICMFDVLEHDPSPLKMLKESNRVLKKGGHIFIVTPNWESLLFRILGFHWKKEHLYYFSPLNMKMLLEKTGFYVVEMKNLLKLLNLSYLESQLLVYETPFLYMMLSFFIGLLPDYWKMKNFSFPLGEMLVVAEKVRDMEGCL